MKSSKLQTIRICCKVTPRVLRAINRLSVEKSVSHQQVVFDLITAQIEGVNTVQEQTQASMATLYRCQLKIAEMDQELTRLIDAFSFESPDD